MADMDDTGLLSINQWTADGTQTEFELSFAGGYLNRNDIHVLVFSDDTLSDGVDTPFTWVDDFQISITPAVASGKVIRVYRQTPYDKPQVDFSDGSIVNEKTLDLNANQAVFLAAELRDRFGLSYEIEGLGDTVASGIAAAEEAKEARDDLVGLQDDVDTILGPNGAVNVGFLANDVNSLTRSVASKLRDIVSVKDFGAQGTGFGDDTAYIQAAIDAYKPTNASLTGGATQPRVITIPAGVYIITAPIKVWSGITLRGEGATTILKAGAGLTTQVIEIAALTETSPDWVNRNSCIENLGIIATGNVRAIKSTSRQYLESIIRNIKIDACYGIDLSPGDDDWWTYTQSCLFEKITIVGSSAAPTEQVLCFRGNRNTFRNINKENFTGTTAEPLIYCKSCDSNVFSDILLEGRGGANKNAWRFEQDSQKNVVRDYWQEFTTATAGYAYDIDGSSEVYLEGYQMLRTHEDCGIRLTDKSWCWMNHLDTSSQTNKWTDWISIDSDSCMTIGRVTSRSSFNQVPLDFGNVRVIEFVAKQARDTPVAGYNQYNRPTQAAGQNLLINGSFEAGEYGWTIPSGWGTVEFIESDIGPGKMLHGTLSANAGGILSQNIVVTAGMVGKPLTLRCRVKITGAGALVARVANVTVSPYQRVDPGTGWNDFELTFRPQTSGTLAFGLQMVGSTVETGFPEVWVDDMTLTVGEAAILSPNKFGSIQLTGKQVLSASAIPTKGDWQVGDIIFNSAPGTGLAFGWVCTVAGTPGTWVAMGTLA